MSKVKEIVGFEWIPSQSIHPYVSIDKKGRLYISKSARELLHVPDGDFFLQVGFDSANRRIGLKRADDENSFPSPYRFDKRSYAKASRFVKRAGLDHDLPCRFLYLGFGDDLDPDLYPSGVHIFKL